MNTITAITLAALLGLATFAIPMLAAFASEPEMVDIPRTWVFVVDKTCNVDTEVIKADIKSIATYVPYIGELEVVCFPNAPMLELVPIVSVLKQEFPNDVFVFVFDFRVMDNKLDWQRFMIAADGRVMEHGFGRAFVTEGYAVSVDSPLVIAHESTHLVLRAVHGVGTNSEEPSTWSIVE